MGSGGGTVTGSGTGNYVPRWNGTTALQNSIIYDSGTTVGINTTTGFIGRDLAVAGVGVELGRFVNNTNGPLIDFIKSRSATVGANAKVSNGDILGDLIFRGADDVDFLTRGARIHAMASTAAGGTIAASKMPADLIFSTAAGTATDDIGEKMRITSDGNVGIGTTAPSSILHTRIANSDYANSVTGASLIAESTGSQAKIVMKVGSKYGVIRTDSAGAIAITPHSSDIYLQSSTIMIVKADGRVGIGTASPDAHVNLHIAGSTYAFLALEATASGGRQYELFSYATDQSFHLYDRTGGGYRLTVDETGNFGVGTITPAYKLDVAGTFRVTGAITASSMTNTLGSAVASTNLQTILNGVASKANRIKFQEAGVDKWLLGQGAASETSAFELYNAAGVIAISVNKTSNLTTLGAGLTVTGTSTLTGAIVSQNVGQATSPTVGSITAAGGIAVVKDLVVGGMIKVGTDGATNGIIRVTGAAQDMHLQTNATTRITIATGGKVTIGSANTDGSAFNIRQGNYNQVNITSNANNGWGLLVGYGDGTLSTGYHGDKHAAIINVQNAPLHLGTGNAPKLTILGNGNVGIGTTAPTTPLDVRGAGQGLLNINTSTTLNASYLSFVNTAGTAYVGITNSTGGTIITGGTAYALCIRPPSGKVVQFGKGDGSAPTVTIDDSGSVGIGTNSPGSAWWTGTRNVHVSSSAAAGFFLTNTTSALELNIASDTGGAFILMFTNQPTQQITFLLFVQSTPTAQVLLQRGCGLPLLELLNLTVMAAEATRELRLTSFPLTLVVIL